MFSTYLILGYVFVSVLYTIPFWKIFSKAGYRPALSLLTIVPVVNMIMIYYVAFSIWPIAKEKMQNNNG